MVKFSDFIFWVFNWKVWVVATRKVRIAKEKELSSKKIEENKMNRGGYCGWSCKHYYEEFLDGGWGIVGDFDSEGAVDYYCNLGHSLVDGRFCEDYEWTVIM